MWSAFCISTPLVSIRRILRSVASVVQGCFHPKTIIYERARVTRREAGTTQGFRENMGSSHLSSSAQIYAPENRSVCPFHASSQDLHAYSQGQKTFKKASKSDILSHINEFAAFDGFPTIFLACRPVLDLCVLSFPPQEEYHPPTSWTSS